MEIKAIILNCTLKDSSEESNTDALIDKAVRLYLGLGVTSEVIRVADYNIKPGVSSDLGKGDDWPLILKRIRISDIIIIATPIWLGNRSSFVQRVLERLDATYSEADEKTGQYPLYNKVAGVIITGNEDGAQNVAAHTLFNLTHLGCMVPPNADSYWVGVAGPGPSYIEAGGKKHAYTNKTIRYVVYNTHFFAQLLKRNPINTNLKELAEEAQKESE